MNSYSFHETRRNPQTAWKVTFNLSFFSPVTHYKQDGSLSSYLSNDSKSKSVCNQRKGDKMDGTLFLKQGSFSSASFKGDKMDGTPFTKTPSLKQKGSFRSALFNGPMSEIILNLEKESEYIQGMVKGTLDPNVFGGYTVQDAAYCFNAVDSYERAAEKMQGVGKPDFSLLYRTQSESFKSYNQYFLQTWRLQNTDSVAIYGAGCSIVRGIWTCLEPKRSQVLVDCHVTMYHARTNSKICLSIKITPFFIV